MTYVTAVTNHAITDYLNVADWTRIYGNARLASALYNIMESTVDFDDVTAPATSTDPTTAITKYNTLLANIERLRLDAWTGVGFPGISDAIQQWTAGASAHAPDYVDVNLWESMIDAIWEYFDGPTLTGPLTLSADLTVPTGTTLIVVDGITTGAHDIILQGTGTLAII